jgi:AcrR family transcriptional regulator
MAIPQVPASGRRYAGLDAEERRAARRAALVAAGLDLFGTHGYAHVSVKQVCDHARLTQRYFYESFVDREAVLRAVYDGVVDAVRERTVAAIAGALAADVPDVLDVASAGLRGFVEHLTDDERSARVLLLEVVGVSPALEERRHAVIHEFADLVRALAVERFGLPAGDDRHGLAAVALVGATNQLLVDWISAPEQRADPAVIADVLAGLFEAAFERLAR